MNNRLICIGDKVTINIEMVYRNGMHESGEQYNRLAYIEDHPNEVYTVLSVNADALANIVLDHEVLGKTSFYEDELILVNDF